MISPAGNRKRFDVRSVLPFVSIALLTITGMLLRPLTTVSAPILALAFVALAFFYIKRKILDIRTAFALCGIGLALPFGTLITAICKTLEWQGSFIAISTAYGFAALIKSEGFLEEFAWITAGFGVGHRSRIGALFLASTIAFIVNAIILSAGSTCAVVAPIFVPLLLRLGFSPPVAVAAVVLGAFGGFVNPVDTGGIAIERTYASLQLPMYSIPFTHLGPAILALVVANVTFATMTRKENHSPESVVPPIEAPRTENRRLQSVIPVLPFILFFPLEFFAWRRNWESNVDTHLAICLIVASIAAALTVIRNSSQGVKKIPSVGKVFFSGMWRGFFEVVLLIVAAKLFISPLRDIIVLFGKQALNAAPILTVASVPTAFLASALIGSGDALALALIPTVLTLVVQNATIYPGVVASMLWLATEMGRNVSPISAATLVSASAVTSTQIEGTTISSYVWRPLLVGFVVGCLALYLVFKWQHLA